MKSDSRKPKQNKNDLLNFILEVSTSFINISPDKLDTAIDSVLKVVGTYAKVDRSYVFQFYDNGTKISNTHEWCADGIEPQIQYLQAMNASDLPFFEKRIKNLEVFHVPDVNRLPIDAKKERLHFVEQSIKSLIVVPIISDGLAIGFLGFDSTRRKKIWSEDIIALLKIVADIFANAIVKNKMMLALKESESRYKSIFEYANDAILLLENGVFVDCNQRAQTMFGFEKVDIIGKQPSELSPFLQPNGDASAEKAFKKIKDALRGKPQFFEWKHMRKDGSLIDTEVSLSGFQIDKKSYLHAFVRDVTGRKNMERLLNKERETLHSVLQKAPYGVVVADKDGRYTYMNPEFTNITGYAIDDVPNGREFFYKAFPDKKMRDEIKIIWKRDTLVKGAEKVLSVRCKDGKIKEINFRPTLLDDGGAVIMLSDITEQRHAEELFKTLADNSPVGVFIVQEGKIKFVNPFFEKITGYKEIELLDRDSMVLVLPEDRGFARKRALEMLKNEKTPSYEIRVMAKSGDVRWILQSITSIQYRQKPAVLGNFVNITEKKQMEEKLRTMSIVDELTQLYNRRGFFTLATQQMKISSRNKKAMLFFFIDLDGLKLINDTFGHQEGDLALISTAQIMRETFRDADVIGRIGGDEFAALAVGTSGTTGELLVSRLHENINSYNSRQDKLYKLSMSVGISIYDPENPSTIDELMSVADTLMYENKKKRKLFDS